VTLWQKENITSKGQLFIATILFVLCGACYLEFASGMASKCDRENLVDCLLRRKTKENASNQCVTCSNNAGKENLKCKFCSNKACAGISVEEFEVLGKTPSCIMFFCSICHPKASLALKFFNNFSVRQESL